VLTVLSPLDCCKDLAWYCEWFLVALHRAWARKGGDKSKIENVSQADLRNRFGMLGVAHITKRCVDHAIQMIVPGNTSRSGPFELYKSPIKWHRSLRAKVLEDVTPVELIGIDADDNDLGDTPPLATQASLLLHGFLTSLLDQTWASAIAGLLASPPPGGLTPEKVFACPKIKPAYDELLKAAKVQGGKDDDQKAKEDKNEDQQDDNKNSQDAEDDDPEDQDTRAKLKADLEEKALKFKKNRIHIGTMTTQTKDGAVEVVKAGRSSIQITGRMIALLDCKCQDDGRIRSTQGCDQALKSYAPLDQTMATVTMDCFNEIMTPGEDFAVILCGHYTKTRRWMEDKTEKLGWKSRPLIVKKSNCFLKQKNTRKGGFFCGKLSEPALVCWKTPVPKTPHALQKHLKVGDSAQRP